MTNRYYASIILGGLYGFFCGAFLWVSLFLIYKIDLYFQNSQISSQISVHPIGFPVKLIPLCLIFMVLSSLIKLIIELFQDYKNSFARWLMIGVISFSTICLIILGEEYYHLGTIKDGLFWFVNKPNNLFLCLLIFILISIYTFLFKLIKDYLLKIWK